ncbi:MAG: hypothetical protein AAB879_03155 [Patescibacteria group bacterium]
MPTFIIAFLMSWSLICGLASVASADASTSYSIGNAVSYPMTFEGKGLAPGALHSLIVAIPVSENWRLVVKGGVATPLVITQPAPQLQFGAVTRVSDGFRLGAMAIYRYVPHWSGTHGDAHVVGMSVAPTFSLSSSVAAVFPIALVYNTTSRQGSFASGFELAFTLPI